MYSESFPKVRLALNCEVTAPGCMAVPGTLCYASSDGLSCCEQGRRAGFMPDVDRTLLRENLKLSFEQRARKHLRVLQMVEELRRAGKELRQKSDGR